MYNTLEVFVHAGPVSLVAMSDLNWERTLLGDEVSSRAKSRLLSIHLGPVELTLESRPIPARGSASPNAHANCATGGVLV